MKRRPWTAAENTRLRDLRDTWTMTVPQIAKRFKRTTKAVEQHIHALRLPKQHRARINRTWLATVRKLNAAGYTDTEVSRRLRCDRHTVSRHRRRLGLPSNARGERYRQRVREATRIQCKLAGVPSLAIVRLNRFRQFARDHGWPDDLRPRAVQILELLRTHGPLTRKQLCELSGMSWLGSRKSLKSNDPEGSYVSHLMRRGLVTRLPRLVKGKGKGYSVHLYALALDATPLDATRCREHA